MKELIKNSKGYIITIIITFITTVIGIFAYNNIINNQNVDFTDERGIKNLMEISTDVPTFSIEIEGKYPLTLTNQSLKDVKTYEIGATISDGVTNTYYDYEGYNLLEVLEALDITDFNDIMFYTDDKLQVTYSKEEVSDNMYLVFRTDGIINDKEEPITLINPVYNKRYNLPEISKIVFL